MGFTFLFMCLLIFLFTSMRSPIVLILYYMMDTNFIEKTIGYQAPEVEVVEVEVERGFEGSTGTGGTGENMGWG
jgi:hypothetical protein